MESLTPREKEAARIAAAGHTNSEVAQEMNVRASTVKQYLNRVYGKLGVENRKQLTYKVESLK